MKKIFGALVATLAFAFCSTVRAGEVRGDLTNVAAEIDNGNWDAAEPVLLDLYQKNPKDAEAMTLLARVEYLRSVDGLSYIPGYPQTGWDKEQMDAAEKWARMATEASPKYAYAWVVYGQINYTRYRLDESLQMLEHAEKLDPSSVKLRLRKGATLWALGFSKGDDALLDAAQSEYRKAILGNIDDGNERLAAGNLAMIKRQRNQLGEAIDLFSDAIETASGFERAVMLNDRAVAYVYDGKADPALADIREALGLRDFGVARETLATVLLLKSGISMRDGDPDSARTYMDAAMDTGAYHDELLYPLAPYPKTFPIAYAFLQPKMKLAGGEKNAYRVFCFGSRIITHADLEKLQSLGADLDGGDGALLFCAIRADNVAMVESLLKFGVDAGRRDLLGKSPLEMSMAGTTDAQKRIHRRLLAYLSTPAGMKRAGVDRLQKDRWYMAGRDIGSTEHGGRVMKAGAILLFEGLCSVPSKDVCLNFDRGLNKEFGKVTIPLSRIDDVKALHELPAMPQNWVPPGER